MTSAASPTGRAHPRSRGENWSDRLYTSDTWGSSPLTRGKPARRGLEGMVRRLIPAHAGKTADTHRRCEYQAAHPRSRGENYQYHHDWYQPSGSSPLTRGKPARRGLEGMVRRLIPAHAGKTTVAALALHGNAAHPRSRGENYQAHATALQAGGSSPLTRGKRATVYRRVAGPRLIPAHAGKTYGVRDCARHGRAHPRSRGENSANWFISSVVTGSSPLTRGKPAVRQCGEGPSRLIPAHAGKTLAPIRPNEFTQAHPRSRGENGGLPGVPGMFHGSSPLTRGKLVAALVDGTDLGLIPAHAGKTASPRRRRQPTAAHPRSRGENTSRLTPSQTVVGSSPLTRGKPCHRLATRPPRRLIPAHAGKTTRRYPDRCGTSAHPRSRGENDFPPETARPRHGSSPLTRGKPGNHRLLRWEPGLIPAHAGKTGRRDSRRVRKAAHPRSRGENRPSCPWRPVREGSSPLTRGKPTANTRTESRSAAHPRSRGENVITTSAGGVNPGSSPLTRGKRRR